MIQASNSKIWNIQNPETKNIIKVPNCYYNKLKNLANKN